MKWSWSCSWYFHINLTEIFFEVFCLGSLEFVRHLWHLGVFWGGVSWPTFWCLNHLFLYCDLFRRASMKFLKYFQVISLSVTFCFGLFTRSDGSILSFFFFDLISWSNHPPYHRSDGTSKAEIEWGFQKSWSHPR